MHCYYCNSTNLRYMWKNWTCCDCCTEQNEYEMVPNEYDIHYEPMIQDMKKCPKDIFDTIENLDTFSPKVIEIGKEIYHDYHSEHIFLRNAAGKMAFAFACLYFASKSSPEYQKPRSFFSSLCDATEFNKACKQIKTNPISKYKTLLVEQENRALEDSIFRVMHANVHDINIKNKMRKTIYKLCDTVNNSQDCKTIHINTLGGTIYYMTCMFNKVQISMTQVAKNFSITTASLIKAERIIKDLLVSR